MTRRGFIAALAGLFSLRSKAAMAYPYRIEPSTSVVGMGSAGATQHLFEGGGYLWAVIYNYSARRVYMYRSSNQGATWTLDSYKSALPAADDTQNFATFQDGDTIVIAHRSLDTNMLGFNTFDMSSATWGTFNDSPVELFAEDIPADVAGSWQKYFIVKLSTGKVRIVYQDCYLAGSPLAATSSVAEVNWNGTSWSTPQTVYGGGADTNNYAPVGVFLGADGRTHIIIHSQTGPATLARTMLTDDSLVTGQQGLVAAPNVTTVNQYGLGCTYQDAQGDTWIAQPIAASNGTGGNLVAVMRAKSADEPNWIVDVLSESDSYEPTSDASPLLSSIYTASTLFTYWFHLDGSDYELLQACDKGGGYGATSELWSSTAKLVSLSAQVVTGGVGIVFEGATTYAEPHYTQFALSCASPAAPSGTTYARHGYFS